MATVSFRAKGPSYIATIAVGHGIKHWYLAAFFVFVPLLEEEYALSAFGVSALVVVRQIGGGLPNFFVGYVSDRLYRYWNLLLPVSLTVTAGAYFLAGVTPWIWPIAVLFSLAAVASSFWHPAAISMLSTRFPDRRGMAIAFHGSGSGAGEALGPLGVGFILAMFLADEWRAYVLWSMIPAVGLALLLWWMLVGAGQETRGEEHPQAKVTDIFTMVRYPQLVTVAVANFSRSFAHFGLLAFLGIYVKDELGGDSFSVGLHVGLLTLLGVGFGPLFGHISDRIGRRVPIVIAMGAIILGMISMGIVGSGIPLLVALGLTGIFLWSVQDVNNAAALDAAPPGTEGTVVGFMFSSSFLAGTLAPFVMAAAINITGSNVAIFYVSGIAVIPAFIYLLFAPLPGKPKR